MEAIDISFETLTPAHCDALTSLYKEIFGKRVTPEYFQIKYGLDLEHQKQYSIVGKIEGEVVGFFGAIPQNFELDGSPYELVYTCDYFLQETYRGKGIFEQLYFQLLERLKATEACYLYAYHSQQTYKFCKKQQWVDQPNLLRFELMTFPKVFKSLLERVVGPSWSTKRLAKQLAPYQIDVSINQLFVQENGGMVHTEDFLKMKAFTPRYMVELEGCTLWLKYEYRLTVGYVHKGPHGNVPKMLKELKKMARRSGIHEVVFHTAPGKERELLRDKLPDFPSFKLSTLQLRKELPSFSRFKVHYMDGDLF